MTAVRNVLFLCTGNSARSIMAEALLGRLGEGRYRAFSAGSQPTGRVNPTAVEWLQGLHYDVSQARSKSWDEFAATGAPAMDVVITVCDNAAGETCPIWPGQPITAHWGFRDPAALAGSAEAKLAEFAAVYRQIESRVAAFVDLPAEELDREQFQRQVRAIGTSSLEPS
jgi:arsenate reductase